MARTSAPLVQISSLRRLVNFRQLRYFVAAYEQGSVSRAAKLCAVGVSTISMQLGRLERELGVSLFNRSAQSFNPTPAGDKAYRLLAPLLRETDFAFNYIRDAGGDEIVDLIAVSPAVPGSALDIALRVAERAFLEKHPQARVRIISPADAGSNVEVALTLDFNDKRGPVGIPDQWRLVQGLATRRVAPQRVSAGELKGRTVHVPTLPPALLASLERLCNRNGAKLRHLNVLPGQLASEALRYPDFRAVLPETFIPPSLRSGRFVIRPMGAAAGVLEIDTAVHSEAPIAQLAREFARLFGKSVGAALRLDPVSSASEGLELRHLRYFAALFQEGHVGRAAEKLNIVQPALSIQLRRLEELVGTALFIRTHAGLVATESGLALYELILPILRDFESALVQIIQRSSGSGRELRVGVMPALDDESVVAVALANATLRWCAEYPQALIRVSEAYSSTLLRWVRNEALDLAVVESDQPSAGLSVRQLRDEPMVVVASQKHDPLAAGPVKLRDLSGLNLVLPSPRHGLRLLLQQRFTELGLKIESKLEIDSMAATLRMVRSGPYVTVLPWGSIASSTARRGLVLHRIVKPEVKRGISAMWLNRRPLSADAARFMDIFQEELPASGGG
ncbi:MAG: LysR family transcriptional regulator [Pseudomonadota bacterium]